VFFAKAQTHIVSFY